MSADAESRCQSTRAPAEQPAERRRPLLLPDGKPNDLDEYDNRNGVGDKQMAVSEASRLGIVPFCATMDRESGDYRPYRFGRAGYQIVTDPEEMPAQLPRLDAEFSRRQ